MKRAATVSGLALVLLASGCSDEGGASPTLPPLTVTPSVTSPETATVSPTAMIPVSAFPDTPQGAAAFARTMYANLDRAFAAKQSALVRPYFDPACKPCNRLIASVDTIRKEGLSVTGGVNKILSAETPGGQGQRVEVSVRIDYSGVTVTDASGSIRLREEPREINTLVTVTRSAATWLVVDMVKR